MVLPFLIIGQMRQETCVKGEFTTEIGGFQERSTHLLSPYHCVPATNAPVDFGLDIQDLNERNVVYDMVCR